MKHFKNLSLLFITATFAVVLSSCSLQEPVAMENAATPQLIQDNGGAIYCRECAAGCVLGYSFTTANIDGNHPQGGYKISVLEGDCKCGQANGKYFTITTGNINTQIGQIGGPASGSLPDPVAHAWTLFNFSCGGGGGIIGGGIQVGESWEHFVHQVNTTYTGPTNLGLVGWPDTWNVTVRMPDPGGNVFVGLPQQPQSQLLDKLYINAMPTGEPIATLNANGADHYELDLSELPTGNYNIELRFAPGFSLYMPLYRYLVEE